MRLIDAYYLVPLLYGHWMYWLPFPLMSILLFSLSLLVLASVAVRLHRRRVYPLLRNVIVVCIPLWPSMLFILSIRVWPFWTVSLFYGTVVAAFIIGFMVRNALSYMLAVLLAAFLYHLGSLIILITMTKT